MRTIDSSKIVFSSMYNKQFKYNIAHSRNFASVEWQNFTMSEQTDFPNVFPKQQHDSLKMSQQLFGKFANFLARRNLIHNCTEFSNNEQ